ncbi:hypothetical protein ABPG75_003375 [Micractinium tetrahymenae]
MRRASRNLQRHILHEDRRLPLTTCVHLSFQRHGRLCPMQHRHRLRRLPHVRHRCWHPARPTQRVQPNTRVHPRRCHHRANLPPWKTRNGKNACWQSCWGALPKTCQSLTESWCTKDGAPCNSGPDPFPACPAQQITPASHLCKPAVYTKYIGPTFAFPSCAADDLRALRFYATNPPRKASTCAACPRTHPRACRLADGSYACSPLTRVFAETLPCPDAVSGGGAAAIPSCAPLKRVASVQEPSVSQAAPLGVYRLGTFKLCPKGTYVNSIAVKAQPDTGLPNVDDVAATGIRMGCSDGSAITADNDYPAGTWSSFAKCSPSVLNNFIVKLSLRSPVPGGDNADDLGTTAAQATCRDGSLVKPGGATGAGDFETTLGDCPLGQAVIGFKQEVEPPKNNTSCPGWKGECDDVGLLRVLVACGTLPS